MNCWRGWNMSSQNMTLKYLVGQPGGPSGPFWSVIRSDGQVIAMMIPSEENARMIASMFEAAQRQPVSNANGEPQVTDAYLDQMFRDHVGAIQIPGWHTRLMRLLRDQMQAEIDKYKPPRCQHEGCEEEGDPCRMSPDEEPVAYFCAAHSQENGFCWGCGLCWAGNEDFDFNPEGLCANCRHDPDIVGYDEDDDDDGDDDFDDAYGPDADQA